MELKHILIRDNLSTASVLLVPLWNWNDMTSRKFHKLLRVLLVPLWNWNVRHKIKVTVWRQFYSYLYGIETTQSEAKEEGCDLFYSYLYGIETYLYNSHIINYLQFYSYLYGIETRKMLDTLFQVWCFTRTFMELKHGNYNFFEYFLAVLLVPLWNWNTRNKILFGCIEEFYSYLYGIETIDVTGKACIKYMFYSYLYGIETQ